MEAKLKKSREEGQRPENKSKNRYKNILPCESVFVILNVIIVHIEDGQIKNDTSTFSSYWLCSVFFSRSAPSVLLFPHKVNDTRVILQDTDPDIVGSDYINANYVKVSFQRLLSHNNAEQFRGNIKKMLFLLLTSSLFVCRTTWGSVEIRKFTLPPRGASQLPSTISGRWCGKRTRGWSSWQPERLRKDGSVLKRQQSSQ